MENKSNKMVTSSRPKNKSLEAYKTWIEELARRFTTEQTKINLSEQDWIDNWQEYWKEQSKSSK